MVTMLASLTLVSTSMAGPHFLSVDSSTDELVRIDRATGAVTVIGALGFDSTNIDLTLLDGVETTSNVRAELYRIDGTTGMATKLGGDLTVGGSPVLNAEGLTHRNGLLDVA